MTRDVSSEETRADETMETSSGVIMETRSDVTMETSAEVIMETKTEVTMETSAETNTGVTMETGGVEGEALQDKEESGVWVKEEGEEEVGKLEKIMEESTLSEIPETGQSEVVSLQLRGKEEKDEEEEEEEKKKVVVPAKAGEEGLEESSKVTSSIPLEAVERFINVNIIGWG